MKQTDNMETTADNTGTADNTEPNKAVDDTEPLLYIEDARLLQKATVLVNELDYDAEFNKIVCESNKDSVAFWNELASYETIDNVWYTKKNVDLENIKLKWHILLNVTMGIDKQVNPYYTSILKEPKKSQNWDKMLIVNLYNIFTLCREIISEFLTLKQYEQLSRKKKKNYVQSDDLNYMTTILKKLVPYILDHMRAGITQIVTTNALKKFDLAYKNCDKVEDSNSIYKPISSNITNSSKIATIDFDPYDDNFLRLEVSNDDGQVTSGLLIKKQNERGLIISHKGVATGEVTAYFIIIDNIQLNLVYDGALVTYNNYEVLRNKRVADVICVIQEDRVIYNGKFAEEHYIRHKYLLEDSKLLETNIRFIGKHAFTKK